MILPIQCSLYVLEYLSPVGISYSDSDKPCKKNKLFGVNFCQIFLPKLKSKFVSKILSQAERNYISPFTPIKNFSNVSHARQIYIITDARANSLKLHNAPFFLFTGVQRLFSRSQPKSPAPLSLSLSALNYTVRI